MPWPTTRSTPAVSFRARAGRYRDAQPPRLRGRAGADRPQPARLCPSGRQRTFSARAARAWAIATGRWSWPAGPRTIDSLRGCTIAVPGTLTTAFLALRMCLGSDLSACRRAVRPDSRRCRRRRVRRSTDRRRADHPRRPAHLWRPEPAAGRRSGAVVDERTGLPLPLGANGIAQGSGHRGHPRRQPPAATKAFDMASSIARPRSTMPGNLAAASTSGRPTRLSACTSTTGRSISASAAAGRAQLLARGHAAGVIPKLVEPEFVT